MLSDSTIDELTGQCHLLWWFPLVSRGGGGACLCVCAPLCLLTLLVSPAPFNPDASHFHHNCAGSRLVTQITSALCERFSRSTWHTYRRPDGWPFTRDLTHAPNCEPITVRTLSRHARNAGQITPGGSETSVACPQEQAGLCDRPGETPLPTLSCMMSAVYSPSLSAVNGYHYHAKHLPHPHPLLQLLRSVPHSSRETR